MEDAKKQVIILGAGYAGLMSAIRLAGKTNNEAVSVTLISESDTFIQRPRLHEVATGKSQPARPLAQMLRGTGVHFNQGTVTALDPQARLVAVHAGDNVREVHYDYLVYALGSHVDRESVPGVAEHAYTLDAEGSRSARPLFDRLAELADEGGTVVIVGSGPTGMEIAGEIADTFPALQVRIVTLGEFGTFSSDRVRDYTRQAMARLNVRIVEHSPVREVTQRSLLVADRKPIPFDICVWAGGFRAPVLAREAGLEVNRRRQIVVDPYLRAVSHPTVYAIGDAAHPAQQPGAPVRMALFPALVMGAHAADNLTRLLQGKAQKPLGFSYYGQGIALGRRDAVGFAAYPDDAQVGPLVTGRLGLVVRNFFVWLILRLLTVERWRPGFFFWLGADRGAEKRRRPTKVTAPKARPESSASS